MIDISAQIISREDKEHIAQKNDRDRYHRGKCACFYFFEILGKRYKEDDKKQSINKQHGNGIILVKSITVDMKEGRDSALQLRIG